MPPERSKETLVRNVMESARLRSMIVIALSLLVVQCGGDDGVAGGNGGSSGPKCTPADLAGGTYSFTLDQNDFDDNCNPPGIAGLMFFLGQIPAGPYSIDLPSYQQLLAGDQPITATLPLVGQVTATFSLVRDEILLTVPGQITVQDVDLQVAVVDITVAVSGTLCPVSGTQVDVVLSANILATNPPALAPCTITISTTGTRQ
jgi:hypothetical protein